MCTIQTLQALILSYECIGHQLKPFADQLTNYLNLQVKGTLFENLTSTIMQHESFQGTECWLEKVVLECLQNLLVHMRKTLHMTGTTMPAKARQYNNWSTVGWSLAQHISLSRIVTLLVKGFLVIGMWGIANKYSYTPLICQSHKRLMLLCRSSKCSHHKRPCKTHITDIPGLVVDSIILNLKKKLN